MRKIGQELDQMVATDIQTCEEELLQKEKEQEESPDKKQKMYSIFP